MVHLLPGQLEEREQFAALDGPSFKDLIRKSVDLKMQAHNYKFAYARHQIADAAGKDVDALTGQDIRSYWRNEASQMPDLSDLFENYANLMVDPSLENRFRVQLALGMDRDTLKQIALSEGVNVDDERALEAWVDGWLNPSKEDGLLWVFVSGLLLAAGGLMCILRIRSANSLRHQGIRSGQENELNHKANTGRVRLSLLIPTLALVMIVVSFFVFLNHSSQSPPASSSTTMHQTKTDHQWQFQPPVPLSEDSFRKVLGAILLGIEEQGIIPTPRAPRKGRSKKQKKAGNEGELHEIKSGGSISSEIRGAVDRRVLFAFIVTVLIVIGAWVYFVGLVQEEDKTSFGLIRDGPSQEKRIDAEITSPKTPAPEDTDPALMFPSAPSQPILIVDHTKIEFPELKWEKADHLETRYGIRYSVSIGNDDLDEISFHTIHFYPGWGAQKQDLTKDGISVKQTIYFEEAQDLYQTYDYFLPQHESNRSLAMPDDRTHTFVIMSHPGWTLILDHAIALDLSVETDEGAVTFNLIRSFEFQENADVFNRLDWFVDQIKEGQVDEGWDVEKNRGTITTKLAGEKISYSFGGTIDCDLDCPSLHISHSEIVEHHCDPQMLLWQKGLNNVRRENPLSPGQVAAILQNPQSSREEVFLALLWLRSPFVPLKDVEGVLIEIIDHGNFYQQEVLRRVLLTRGPEGMEILTTAILDSRKKVSQYAWYWLNDFIEDSEKGFEGTGVSEQTRQLAAQAFANFLDGLDEDNLSALENVVIASQDLAPFLDESDRLTFLHLSARLLTKGDDDQRQNAHGILGYCFNADELPNLVLYLADYKHYSDDVLARLMETIQRGNIEGSQEWAKHLSLIRDDPSVSENIRELAGVYYNELEIPDVEEKTAENNIEDGGANVHNATSAADNTRGSNVGTKDAFGAGERERLNNNDVGDADQENNGDQKDNSRPLLITALAAAIVVGLFALRWLLRRSIRSSSPSEPRDPHRRK
jgi:heme/copper-type cytochrome/quinol oxidase subunit 2